MDESSDNLIANNSFGDLDKEVGDEDLMMDDHSHAILQQHHEEPVELHPDLALKRSHDQVHGDEVGLEEDPESKRLKLPPYIGGAAAAAAKKANHEQWETMFARLVEYKEAHGVSVKNARLLSSVHTALLCLIFYSFLSFSLPSRTVLFPNDTLPTPNCKSNFDAVAV
jgi:hypothetical protein